MQPTYVLKMDLFLYFFLMSVPRLFKKNEKIKEKTFEEKLTELGFSNFSNVLLETIMRTDKLLLSMSISIPCRGSLKTIVKKQ